MRESTVERAVCQFARDHGCLVLKLAPSTGQKGQPDRLVLLNGLAMFVEFKAPGKKLRKLQKRWINRLTDLGFKAIVIDNVMDGHREITDFVGNAEKIRN